MSDSGSLYDSEPNVFDGESSDDQRDTGSEALSFGNADNEVEVIGEKIKVVPSFCREKVLQTDKAMPLAVVPCDVDCASTS